MKLRIACGHEPRSRILIKRLVPALSLCVSLWMAGGSVEAATEEVDGNTTIHGDHHDTQYKLKNGGVTFTVADDGVVQRIFSETSGNTVIVESGGTIRPYDELPMIAGVKNNVFIFKGTQEKSGNDNYPTLYGGYSTTAGEIAGNEVTIDGGTVYGAVCGGKIDNDGSTASVHNNTVTVKNGKVSGEVYGGESETGDAKENHVTITDSTVGNVRGGATSDANHSAGDALNNTVTIRNSTVGSVTGGYSQWADAKENIVTISNSTVNGPVYGGNSYEDIGNGVATHNIVTLTDVTVTGDVYGGHTGSSKDSVSGNTLNLSGANRAAGIQNFQFINITGSTTWNQPVMTLTGGVQNADGSKAIIDASALKFEKPETFPDGGTMNLIDCGGGATITAELAATQTALQEYTAVPVTGVLINAALQGRFALTNKALTLTAENKASKLTFTDVEWKHTGALLDRKTIGVAFDGADVDTTNINFTNIRNLAAGRKMTLISDFGDSVGTITGTKYKVGSTLEGMGKASLVGNDLIFTTETSVVQEQTHNTVMGAEAGMAALSAGNDFVGAATEGLGLVSNIGADGVSSYANMGGGSMRQETGSHVDTHTWNAILAIGHENKKGDASFQYGAFFEYGTGNYTTFNGDERGDGSTHYTGGGFLAKYTMRNNVYVEGSLRAGSIHDDARNVLRDDNGAPYSYETNAPYFGAHVGVGKEIPLTNGNVIDVYGKYFFNRRNGVSFDAGGCYDLDAVTSQVLRVGARYTVKRDKWNFYGGLAYEHELDGEATGKADGAPIRGADTKGGSFRGEIGATMTPGENSPWSLDLNLSGFAGKKQGFTGGVSVAFMF